MAHSDNLMQAAVLSGHGGPEKIAVTTSYPVPNPGPGEVLVRVGAAGMNNTDIWSRKGAYSPCGAPPAGWRGKPLNFPRIQGGDVAGRIVATGEGISETRIGQRVLVNALLYAKDGDPLLNASLLGSERDGGFAEYVSVPAENAFPIDTRFSDTELATFPIAWLTALHMLNRARLTNGETVMITGASGGVGSALVQLATIRGAKVLATTTPDKQSFVKSLGADTVIDRTAPDLPERLQEATPIDVVADIVGGPDFPNLLDSLRGSGRYVTAGAIAGPEVNLDLRTLYLRHLELVGSTMGTQDEFATLVQLIGEGRVRPLLDGTWPLSEIHRAQREFEAKQFTGNLVLVPDAIYQSDPVHQEAGPDGDKAVTNEGEQPND